MKRQTILFCDGACSGNPGPGGWGVIVALPDEVFELGGRHTQTTNNKMELSGAIEALKAVQEVPGEVMLCTDSSYVIQGITRWIFGWLRNGWKSSQGGNVLNQEFWQELHRLVTLRGKSNPVHWQYVPGHSNVAGNERVDQIAVAFSKQEPIALYRGSRDSYGIDLSVTRDTGVLRASQKSKKRTSGKAIYLSLVGTIPSRHASWSECERRVKGQSQAKFKKVSSPEEEESVWRAWGVDPQKVK